MVGNDSFIHSLIYSFSKPSLRARYVLNMRDTGKTKPPSSWDFQSSGEDRGQMVNNTVW